MFLLQRPHDPDISRATSRFEAKMIDPLLHQMVKTAAMLKLETERADTPEMLSRVERLATLLTVQAAEAQAIMRSPGYVDPRANSRVVSLASFRG
jgi:hypothetical protein